MINASEWAEGKVPAIVRPDFVPKEGYLSREWLQLEKDRLWPRVWQVACREEEIPQIGDYVSFEIADESIIIVRVAVDKLKAYYNVCQHRGRRLLSGCGRIARFHCRFHGWQWHLDGSIARVLDRPDWDGCADFDDSSLRLKELRLDTWGGFVFVNMDSAAEPLHRYLDPINAIYGPYEFEKMRYRWYKSIKLPCNWKVAVEAFNEAYHVFATHPQLLDTFGDDETRSFAHGKHAMFGYFSTQRPVGTPSSRTGKPLPTDIRAGVVDFFKGIDEQLAAVTTQRGFQAATRLLTEVPEGTSPQEIFAKVLQFQREAALAEGAGWPDLTAEQIYKAGTDWHAFPNLIMLASPEALLAYRARPFGDDPDWCIFDIWSLQRYGPAAEPPLKREFYYGDRDWCTDVEAKVGRILAQDVANMSEVQKGMKSRGFVASRTNPIQETPVSNFHRVIHEYLFGAQETQSAKAPAGTALRDIQIRAI
jgi:phenylpropionate dioxygenase-like ring-hydroxylating dioxygenase large terminal subunit